LQEQHDIAALVDVRDCQPQGGVVEKLRVLGVGGGEVGDFFDEAVIADARANLAAALRLREVVVRCLLELIHQQRYVRDNLAH
jgi:hypothetical protein